MKKEEKESSAQRRYQRHSVHRYSAGAAGDLHDDHALDSEGTRCRGSAAAAAGNSATAARTSSTRPSSSAIDKSGIIKINQDEVDNRLSGRQALQDIFKTRNDRTVFVNGDPDLLYNDVVQIIDIAKGVRSRQDRSDDRADSPLHQSSRRRQEQNDQKTYTDVRLLAFLALAATSCAKLQARDNLNKGVRAFTKTQIRHGDRVTSRKRIKLDPDLTNAELYLATAYSQQFIPGAQSEETTRRMPIWRLRRFNRFLSKDPNNVTAIAGLASIYQNTNESQKAREFYLKIREIEPNNPIPLLRGRSAWIGSSFSTRINPPPPEEQGASSSKKVLQHLDKALALNPDYEDAMTYKNLLLREKARLAATEDRKRPQLIAQADEWFNKALETRKKNAGEASRPGGITLDRK